MASLTHCPQPVGFEAHSRPCICNYFSISGARVLSCCSRVRLSATPWTAARQAPLSMRFPGKEDWSGLPFPPPGDLPDPGIEPACLMSPVLAGGLFTTGATGFGRGSVLPGQRWWRAPCFRAQQPVLGLSCASCPRGTGSCWSLGCFGRQALLLGHRPGPCHQV